MSQELRRWFNANWTPEKYQAFLAGLDADTDSHVDFRVSETPCFFEEALADRMCESGIALLKQVVGNAEYQAVSERAIPEEYRVPHEAAEPMFVQVDYGVVRDEAGNLHPRLVEIQGFPSLYALQPLMAEHYKAAYGLPADLKYLLQNLSRDQYNALLRRAIVGEHDPENVILMEIDPELQKTRWISGRSNKKGKNCFMSPGDGACRSTGSTIGRLLTNWSGRGRRRRSPGQRIWMSNGPDIRTGISGFPSFRFRSCSTRRCRRRGSSIRWSGCRRIRRTGC